VLGVSSRRRSASHVAGVVVAVGRAGSRGYRVVAVGRARSRGIVVAVGRAASPFVVRVRLLAAKFRRARVV